MAICKMIYLKYTNLYLANLFSFMFLVQNSLDRSEKQQSSAVVIHTETLF